MTSNSSAKDQRSWIEIDLSAFRHNFLALKRLLPSETRIMQIVKADAYGHGALEIARIAIECGASALGVANADEGALLRYHGYDLPILILSPALKSEIALILDNNLIPSVSSIDFAKELTNQAKSPLAIHLNIDTGMGRSGAKIREAVRLYDFCLAQSNLEIQGIYTHFAAAENDKEYTDKQIGVYQNFLDQLPELPQYLHTANSSALLNQPLPPGNLVRLGALSYGFYTDPSQRDKIELEPVLKFKSYITQIKEADKGEYIGYNCTYRCENKLKYAIIPVGYADGYDYLLSNRAQVQIKGVLHPVIGKVSMDMIAVDISADEKIRTGEEVTLMGDSPDLRVENIAARYKGSAYELLCQIGRRAPRFYYDKGNLISSAPLLRREFISSDYNDVKLNRIIESAVRQRLQSSEIASFVYHDLLKSIFSDQDNNIFFRRKFLHEITFSMTDLKHGKKYYRTTTKLSYYKTLTSSSFKIACASSSEKLAKYFQQPEIEYRWLLDNKLSLSPDNFKLISAQINDIELYSSYQVVDDCLLLTCYNEKLNDLIGTEVKFTINTLTWYPADYHQLTVYINGITKDFDLKFSFPSKLEIENVIPILAGKDKFPRISKTQDSVTISSRQWHFPSSGVVFIYHPSQP